MPKAQNYKRKVPIHARDRPTWHDTREREIRTPFSYYTTPEGSTPCTWLIRALLSGTSRRNKTCPAWPWWFSNWTGARGYWNTIGRYGLVAPYTLCLVALLSDCLAATYKYTVSDKRVSFNHGHSGMIRCLCKIDEPCFCCRLHDGRTATAHSTVLCRLTRDWGFSIHAEKESACRGTGSIRDLTGIFFLSIVALGLRCCLLPGRSGQLSA